MHFDILTFDHVLELSRGPMDPYSLPREERASGEWACKWPSGLVSGPAPLARRLLLNRGGCPVVVALQRSYG